MDKTNETIGIIFPLLPTHIPRFFDGEKTVFVKFIGSQRTPLRLHVGSKLFFYESERSQEIVGEARIVGISMATAAEIRGRHGAALFLTPDELRKYAAHRMDKRMLVLNLKNPRRYPTPLKLKKSVTMAGRYMTEQMLSELNRGAQ